jgi:hypothetical protein
MFTVSTNLRIPGATPNLDEILTGWIAVPTNGYTGGGTRGRIRTPETGAVA